MPEQRVSILIYRPDGTLVAQYLLGDGEHLIGRDINCPIYLDSEYISSNHAKLHLSAEGIYIEDLNSTSGTFLDGVTVRGKLRIKPGQVLQVGDLTVDLQPESVDNVGPGSRLGDGRYTLIRLLGRGGMGEVWLAKDEQLDEEVALKKIPHEVAADAMALADMRREVQKSRGLTHQNIIRIHDLYFKPGEDPFISLEYVDGRDLTHIIATKTNGFFPWEEIKPLVLQLCEALEYAHGQKIVHRDLKPANLMITRDSRLKLADFGIAATMVDSLSRSSIQGFVSGTTLYMSPQQMEGEAPQASDDIYAFGATLYELLTSRPPFYTGDMQHQVQQVIPKPMEQRLQEFGFTNNIPEYVQQLVMSCLAKEPEGRPKSMEAIRKWIKSEGEDKAAIPKPTTKTVKRARTASEPLEPELTPAKKRAKYAALAAVIAVVIGLGFWAKNQIEDLGNGQQPARMSGASKTNGKGIGSSQTNGLPVQPTNQNPATNSFNPRPEPGVNPIIPKAPQIIIVPPLGVTTAATPASLKQGLIAYFPFDDGNSTDRSGNGHIPKIYPIKHTDGEHHGPGFIPVADRLGNRKGALFTDGRDDGFIIPSLSSTNKPVSFATWIFPVPPPKIQDTHRVILDGYEKGKTEGIRLEIFEGKITAYVGNKDGAIGRVNGSKYVDFNQWHHIACIHDGKNIYLYQNGKETGRDSAVGLPVLGKIHVGSQSVDGREPFIGILDDIRIYERPLSPKEVLLLAKQTSKSPRPEDEMIINPKAGYRLKIAQHRKLSSMTNSIGKIRFSPDGRSLAAVTGDGAGKAGGIMIWNVSDGKELLALTRKSSCLSIAWNPAGDKIVVGRKDGVVELINIDKGDTKATYQTEGISQSRALHFNRVGNKLAVAGAGIPENGKGIKIISINDSSNGDQNATVLYWLKGSSPWRWNDHNYGPSNFHEVDWSFDGKLIAATGTKFTFTIWDAVSGLPKYRSPDFLHSERFKYSSRGVSFSPKGERLMGSSYQNIIIMDSQTGKTKHRILGHSGYVNSVAWSPNGKYVVSGGQGVCNDELVTIWDAETGMEILTFTGPKRNLPPIKKGEDYPVPECVSVAWSPDGTKLAYAVKIHHRKTDQLKGDNISVNEQGEYATEHYIQIWDFPHDGETSKSDSNQTGSSAGSGSVQPTNPSTAGKKYPTLGEIERLDPELNRLIATDAKIERLADGFDWAEGPVWVEKGRFILFSDIPPNKIYKWSEAGGLEEFLHPSGYTGKTPRGGEPGSNGLLIDQQGRLVLCQHGDRRIARLGISIRNPKPIFETLADNFQGKKFNSPNDACYNKNGDLYFTDPPYGLEGHLNDPKKELGFQGVYFLAKTGGVKLLTDKIAYPNGIALSPDEKTLYVAESGRNTKIHAFNIRADGAIDEGRVFFNPAPLKAAGKKGGCDGLKIDEKGNLFATGPGGVLVITPGGRHLGTISTGTRIANVGWGDDGRTLYLTADNLLCRIRTLTKGAGF